MEECPVNIEHVQEIMGLKRYKALTLGQIPPEAATAVNNIRVNGNPWGVSQDERFAWADGMDVPVIEQGKKVDYLYYVGCAGSYDNNNQKVVQDTVTLLKKAVLEEKVKLTSSGFIFIKFSKGYSVQKPLSIIHPCIVLL